MRVKEFKRGRLRERGIGCSVFSFVCSAARVPVFREKNALHQRWRQLQGEGVEPFLTSSANFSVGNRATTKGWQPRYGVIASAAVLAWPLVSSSSLTPLLRCRSFFHRAAASGSRASRRRQSACRPTTNDIKERDEENFPGTSLFFSAASGVALRTCAGRALGVCAKSGGGVGKAPAAAIVRRVRSSQRPAPRATLLFSDRRSTFTSASERGAPLGPPLRPRVVEKRKRSKRRGLVG